MEDWLAISLLHLICRWFVFALTCCELSNYLGIRVTSDRKSALPSSCCNTSSEVLFITQPLFQNNFLFKICEHSEDIIFLWPVKWDWSLRWPGSTLTLAINSRLKASYVPFCFFSHGSIFLL